MRDVCANNPLLSQQTEIQTTGRSVFPHLVVIGLLLIAGTLGIFTCVLNHYKIGTRRQDSHTTHTHQHLNTCQSPWVSARALVVSRDPPAVRLHSDLPPSISMPDGEEAPYGSFTPLHIRDPEQESEIYRECIRPPPNRTVFEIESPPPYRCASMAALSAVDPHEHQRCNSLSSATPATHKHCSTPQRQTSQLLVRETAEMSGYTDSRSLSSLSALQIVPCMESTRHTQNK